MTPTLSALPAKRRGGLKFELRLVCPSTLIKSAQNLPSAGRHYGVVLREGARVAILAQLCNAHERGDHVANSERGGNSSRISVMRDQSEIRRNIAKVRDGVSVGHSELVP